MQKDQPNDDGDYFDAKERFGGLSGLGSIQFTEEDPLEDTRRLMPAFMEAKWQHRTKVGHPLTVTNRKAYADPTSKEEFYSSKLLQECTEVTVDLRVWKPTTKEPKPPTRTWGLIRTEGDRAKWVEIIENAKKED